MLAAGLGALAGCPSRDEPETPTRTTTPDGTEPTPTRTLTLESDPESDPEAETTQQPTPDGYDRIVNVVEAGADSDGDHPVTPILEEVADDDTLVYFPAGTYRFESPWRFEGYSNLGVVGDRATLVPGDDLGYWTLAFDVEDFHLEGFTLDHRGRNVGPQVQLHVTGGHSVVRDLTYRGLHDSGRIAFTPYVESEDASLLVERLRVPDGTQHEAAVYLGPESVGEVSFVDCYLDGCAQGIYGSAHSGPFTVVGGRYVNNNRAGIRVGGGNHGAHVRGVHVRIDDPYPERWTNRQNVRGIWVREGDEVRIEDSTVELVDLDGIVSDGAIVVGNLAGRVTIRDTHVRVDDRTYAVRANLPSSRAENLQGIQGLPDGRALTCENLVIDGDVAALSAFRVMGRDGSTFRNLEVDQPEGNRRGLVVGSNATDVTVSGGSIRTAHYPLVVEADRETFASSDCPVRIEDGARFEATALAEEGDQLAVGESGSFCVDGGADVEDARRIVVAVLGVEDGTLFGTRMSSETFRGTYGE